MPIFCGLTATDGFMLMGREKVDKFDWKHAQGQGDPRLPPGQHAAPVPRSGAAQERPRSAEGREAQQQRRDPGAGRLLDRGPEPVRIFLEPDPSQLEIDGKAHFLASIGETVGPADYTVFMATDKYIKENPEVVQTWTNAIYKAHAVDRIRSRRPRLRRRSSNSSPASTRRR